MALSVSKQKVCKETIYVKKHNTPMYSLEEIITKYKSSKNKVEEVADFFIQKVDYEKIRFTSKMIGNSDGKYKMNINQIKDTIQFLIVNAVENFINNPIDACYISENLTLNVSNYSGKHYLSIGVRYDFTK